jgi:DNA-binding XRE family transcriptional regulator
MAYKVSCLLPALRKRWALTQGELAQLLGNVSHHHVSCLELEQKEPSMAVLFGLELIFGQHPKEIFVKFFDAVEEEVVRNLYKFQEELGEDDSPTVMRKRQLVAEALSRAVLQTRIDPGYEA